MSIGVAVLHDDARVTDEVAHAIDRCEGMYVAGFADDERAEVVLAGGAPLAAYRPDGAGLVVLATADPVADARAGFDLGAAGLLRWPDDVSELGRAVARAALRSERRAEASRGVLVAVAGARGGAGATTLACLLARSRPDALLIDLDPGAGQLAYAPDGVEATSLARAVAAPTPEVIAQVAEPHASGRALLHHPGSPLPDDRAVSALAHAARLAAPLVVVDAGRIGAVPVAADRTFIVCSDDIGSLRASRAFLDDGGEAEFVLNRRRRRGLRANHLERALGRGPVAVVPPDRRLARAADLGAPPRRLPRALRRALEGMVV